MIESLVQWTLLHNKDKLSKILNFDIAKIIGQEITTDFGRIDFALIDNKNNSLIVELETTLDNKSKIEYCKNQIINYKNIKFSEQTEYCILYADETKNKNKQLIEKFGKENDVYIYTYSIESTKHLYRDTIDKLTLNVGLALPSPKNYTICYLRWLNKIMLPFLEFKKTELTKDEVFIPFKNKSNSQTNFNCHLRIANDFELLYIENEKYILTDNGKNFINNISPFANSSNISSINLTNEQKRLILSILTNGNWENKIHKVNIYWFLRFMEVTLGEWIPRKHNFDQSKLEIARGLFNVSYNSRTMQEFLNWCCNYCIELNLVERIKSTTDYDKLILTPLGVEINNIFSLDLTLKRNRMNLNFKFMD
jgi:hypothetical protein